MKTRLFLHSSGANFALLAHVECFTAVGAVPFCRPRRDLCQADTFKMEPLLLAVLLVMLVRSTPLIHIPEERLNESLTSTLSHCIMVPKLTRLHKQYRGSSGSIGFPSSSTSSISVSTWPLSFRVARAFFLGAAFLLPTALLPPLLVVLTMPGAGRLVRLPGGRASGAGVLRAVLARRGLSAADEGCGSWLIALPREPGRRPAYPSGAGVVRGVGPREADCLGGGSEVACDGGTTGVGCSICCCCCIVLFAASPRVSLLVASRPGTGGAMGVVDFLPSGIGIGTGVSAGNLTGTDVVVVLGFGVGESADRVAAVIELP